MSFDFKKLSDVSNAKSVLENTNVIVEENGIIKKVSNFVELVINKTDVLEEISEESYVLVEEEGRVKRVPKTAVGGSGAFCDVLFVMDFNASDEYAEMRIGDYETLVAKYNNKEPIIALVYKIFSGESKVNIPSITSYDLGAFGDEEKVMSFECNSNGEFFSVLPDNTVRHWYD